MREPSAVSREPKRAIQPRHYGLEVWKNAMRLVSPVYRIWLNFRERVRFGLTLQVRRAAVSVPSNIAEGAARGTRAELVRYLMIARGSLSEMDTQLCIARDLGYLGPDQWEQDAIQHLFAKINSLIRANQRPTKTKAS
jgi:four helix bundle protein